MNRLPALSDFEVKTPREIVWGENEDFNHVKKAILSILKEEKVSLSKIRGLFRNILEDIEDNNPINF